MKLAKSRLKRNEAKWYYYIPSASLWCVCALIAGIQAVNNNNIALVKGQPYIKESIVIAKEELKPLKTVVFTPDRETIKLINKYPDLSSKIKDTFGDDWTYTAQLIKEESSFNKYAINPTSGACGLGQSLPCSKMDCDLADEQCQLDWMKKYIKNRYKTPQRALEFWNEKKAECLEKEPTNLNCGGWY